MAPSLVNFTVGFGDEDNRSALSLSRQTATVVTLAFSRRSQAARFSASTLLAFVTQASGSNKTANREMDLNDMIELSLKSNLLKCETDQDA